MAVRAGVNHPFWVSRGRPRPGTLSPLLRLSRRLAAEMPGSSRGRPPGGREYELGRPGNGFAVILGSRIGVLILWQLRVAFRVLVWLATSVGRTMVALASAFRACRRASADLGPLVVPAQMALLFAWAPARLLFLALESSARRAHRTHVGLYRRRAALA